MKYETLTTGDRLLLAQDALRGRESDHYRLSMTEPDANTASRIRDLETEIERIKGIIADLDKEKG